MVEKSALSLDQSEISVGAERLHQALHRAESEFFGKSRISYSCGLAVKLKQLDALAFAQLDIGIVQKRSKIVFRQTRAHPLEINQIRLTIAQNDVLRLKIAMHQDAWKTGQTRCNFGKSREFGQPLEFLRCQAKVPAKA